MRAGWFLLMSLIAFGPTVALGGDDYPYTAKVLRDQTPVRSGPTEKYYPTDLLPRGEEVEVYRHETGDWYAIRPPKGSFSWVSAAKLKLQDDNLAEVMVTGAVAYVGSRLSDARTVRQIYLEKGETLEIVGEKEFIRQEGGLAERWYKILPPSGEFRWISGEHIEQRVALADRHNSFEDDPEAYAQLQHQTGIVSGAPESLEPVEKPIRMDLQLSMIITGPLATWDFDELKMRAETELQNAPTALERGRARLVLTEIARFEALKDKTLASGENMPEKSSPQVTLATPPPNPLKKIPAFQGVGRLTPVVSKKQGAPKFALTDVKGKVIMFVSPATGVDLRPHLGKVVGVSGARGYMPRLKKAHLSVSQVERLEPTALVADRPGRPRR